MMRRTALIKSNNPHLAGGEQPSPGRWGKKKKLSQIILALYVFSFCERTFLIWYEPI